MRTSMGASALPLLLAGIVLGGCGGEAQRRVVPGVPVVTGLAARKDVPVQLTLIGRVEPIATVSVKSQVTGTLEQVHFAEGDDVAEGDLLFTIDPRPFRAALAQARANLARDRAQAENAALQAQRYGRLIKEELIPRDQYDQAVANARALAATVAGDEAAVRQARLDLAYCSIRAPISGRTGSLLATEGNLIKANADTGMVVINQISPIYVTFAVPEARMPEIRRSLARGPVRAGAAVPAEPGLETGEVTFLGNAVDPTTGTIQLKATFANADRRLWPGQFVNVTITLAVRRGAVVVPTQAVQMGQSGDYVFVVKADLTVEQRPVIVAFTLDRETVIERGVEPGERVVTEGQLRLQPGAKVELRNRS